MLEIIGEGAVEGYRWMLDQYCIFIADHLFSAEESHDSMGVASSAVFYSGAWIHPLSDPWTEFPQGQDVQDEGDRG